MKNTQRIFAATLAGLLLFAAVEAQAAGRTRRSSSRVKGVVNINDAPLSKLVLLPYVGRGKAKAIMAYRKNRRFSRPADLTRVAGIGRKTFLKIKSHVTVTGPTTIRRVKSVRARKAGAAKRGSAKASTPRGRTKARRSARRSRR